MQRLVHADGNNSPQGLDGLQEERIVENSWLNSARKVHKVWPVGRAGRRPAGV